MGPGGPRRRCYPRRRLSPALCPERGGRGRRAAAPPPRDRCGAAAAGTCARAGVSAAGPREPLPPSPERDGTGPARPRPPQRSCPRSPFPPACCQMVQALLAVLILVCASVSCGPPGGYTGLPDLGGIYYYQYGGAYSGFSGADGEKARELDQRFYLLKLPVARAAMAVGGCLLAVSCILLSLGVLRIPWRFPAWLLLECALDVVVAVGMVPALYYYFHCLLEVYNSSVCKEREQLYQSKGYQGFRCSLHAAEVAAGLWGCVVAMAYLLSAGLAARAYTAVRTLKQKPVQLE